MKIFWSLLLKILHSGSVLFKGLIDKCGGESCQFWGQHCQCLCIFLPPSSKETKALN